MRSQKEYACAHVPHASRLNFSVPVGVDVLVQAVHGGKAELQQRQAAALAGDGHEGAVCADGDAAHGVLLLHDVGKRKAVPGVQPHAAATGADAQVITCDKDSTGALICACFPGMICNIAS